MYFKAIETDEIVANVHDSYVHINIIPMIASVHRSIQCIN